LEFGGRDTILIEDRPRVGGKIVTQHVGGLVIEGGPDCFLSAKPAGVALCRTLGLDDRLIGTNPNNRKTFVKRGGRLHPLPDGLTGLVPSRLSPLLTTSIMSPAGRIRAGLEMFVRANPVADDESIAQFVTRRFGSEAYHWLVEPLLSGIYAGNGEHLSLKTTFPRLAAIERTHGSILRQMMRRGPRSHASTGSDVTGFVTLRGGLAELVAALEARLHAGHLKRGVAVTAVRSGPSGYDIELRDGTVLGAEAVILATPAYVTAQLLREFDYDLSSALATIPFVSTATVSVAFPASAVPRKLNGYGYVSPRAEGGPIVACTWTSNKFPERVSGGDVLIRFFIGREGAEEVAEWSDDLLLDVARAELAKLFGITEAPRTARVFRWPRAMPQYTIGHSNRLSRIDMLLERHRGLHLAGNSYRGVGIPDCIASGWSAADAVAKALDGHTDKRAQLETRSP
jgi:oxygen-dependent protoporphyrinogen oxidase